ncbi:hypothetical protein P692DRAFT_20737632, partial [Suillus brevipes Sb2]
EIKGKCCTALGGHRLAHEAFNTSLQDTTYTLTGAHSIPYCCTVTDLFCSIYGYSNLTHISGRSYNTMSICNDGNGR